MCVYISLYELYFALQSTCGFRVRFLSLVINEVWFSLSIWTGYSFVEGPKLLVKTDDEPAAHLTTLLIQGFNRIESLQKSPL